MSDIFVEHIIKKKLGIKEIAFRILAVLVTVATLFFGVIFLHMLGITITILVGYLAYLVFVYTSVEYEYSLVNGELSIDKIMGQRKRKKADEFDIKLAELIAPTFSDDVRTKNITATLDYSTGYKSDALYSIILNQKTDMVQVIFEPNERMIDAMYHMRPNIVKKAEI